VQGSLAVTPSTRAPPLRAAFSFYRTESLRSIDDQTKSYGSSHVSFRGRGTEELVRIAAAGGGFRLAGRPRSTEDLVRIAAAASGSGARIILTGMRPRETEELVRIGAAGGGAVFFEEDD
jgi:hypothetical protein